MKTIRNFSSRANLHVHGSGTAEAVFSGLIDARSLQALKPQLRFYAPDATAWLLDFSGAALMLPDGPVEGLGEASGRPVALIVPAGFSHLSVGRDDGVICALFQAYQATLAVNWLERQKRLVCAK